MVKKAVCVMRGDEGVKGVVHFSQDVSKIVLICMNVLLAIFFLVPINELSR